VLAVLAVLTVRSHFSFLRHGRRPQVGGDVCNNSEAALVVPGQPPHGRSLNA